MKIILSHDVDHVTVWEHLLKDAVVPKFIVRSNLELLKGMIGLGEYLSRVVGLFRNKWNAVDELIAFHLSKKIKSSFFVGVSNGVGLSYSLANSANTIRRIISNGFEVGVHGINFESPSAIQYEHDLFKKLSGEEKFGIRMHYLRMNENTSSSIKQSGYSYDATESGMSDPYLKNGLPEFPLQIMDGWAIEGGHRFQSRTLQQAKDYTMKTVDEAVSADLHYMSILFHDRYFSKSFKTWLDWYVWLVEYLENRGFSFVDYRTAVKELYLQ